MAIVQLQRAQYRPRLPVIHYVVSQRVLVRSRPSGVRNPRTKAQQANRHKLSVASRFLSQLQDVVVEGFRAGERPNGRAIGAYHMALGHLLNGAMRREAGQWRIDYANVQLAEGQSLEDFPLRVNRQGRTLRLSWEKGLPEGTQRIRLALHSPTRSESLCFEVNAPKWGKTVEVQLPKWVEPETLHLWWIPIVKGKTRWRSKYLFLPKGLVIVVGWMAMRKCMGRSMPTQKTRAAAGIWRRVDLNPSCAMGVGVWDDG